MPENTTKFEDIYKIFLSSIHDYRLKKLFAEYFDVAEDLMLTYLKRAITEFYNCQQDIQHIDEENKCFYVQLSLTEITILADLMVIVWLRSKINDIRQAELTLNDIDYKHYSEEKNLLGKSKYLNELRGTVDQKMVQYGLNGLPISEWAGGMYDA